MIKCQQAVSLVVNPPPVPDWSQMDWGHPQVAVVFAGSPVLGLNPTTGMSASYQGTVQYSDQSTDDFTLSNTGNLIVPGYAQNCNMQVTLFRTLAPPAAGNIIMFGLTTFPGFFFTSITPNGVYNIPFSLPNNGGVPNLVRVRFTVSTGFTSLPPVAPLLSLDGTVSNV